MTPSSALAGFRVVEYGNNISAAFCAKLMGDLGAEVIKVERLQGDESRQRGPFPNDVPDSEKSALFLYLNTNKRGVTLNVEDARGRDLFLRLMKRADLLVENNAPAHMERLGLTYQTLQGVNSALVATSITPFGQSGPYRDFRGYSIQASAMGGVTTVNGSSDREPLAPPYDLMDYAGGLYGCATSCVALLERDMSGLGQHVDVSVSDCIAAMHTGLYIWDGLTVGRRSGRSGRGEVFPNGLWRCKDGYISMIAPQVAQWIRFVKVMGDPEWTKQPRYRDRHAMATKYPEEVDALLAPWLMEHTKDEIFALCREAHVPVAPVQTIDEVMRDEQLQYRGFFTRIFREDIGEISAPGSPYHFSETPCAAHSPPPKLGEHNENVFCGDLGLSNDDLEKLRRSGVI
ncbi:MAG: CoA transferase [Dehalococcoidia bacterium]|nr:CoA transferase [Dehalococcoidia bacterium]